MEQISESAFAELPTAEITSENASVLTVVLDLSPRAWFAIKSQISIQETVKALLVFLNAHLALNNSNQVAVIASSSRGSRFLHPSTRQNEGGTDGNADHSDNTASKHGNSLVSEGMYRQFRIVDTAVLSELNEELIELSGPHNTNTEQSTLAGALSMALTYTNRMLRFDPAIATTKASAINATASSDQTTHTGNSSSSSMDARVLVISASDALESSYIAIMNAIFAAQKMRVPIDVAQLGPRASPYLQQAADATRGVFLHVTEPKGLVQTLATAYFVEPSLREIVVLPTSANVDYKASCFVTGRPVDVGYVCSVCLCILSMVPESGMCPTCKSHFDESLIAKLRKGPVIARKKRKVVEGEQTEGVNVGNRT